MAYNLSIQIDGGSDIIVIIPANTYASDYLIACIEDAVDNGDVDSLEAYLAEQYGEGVFKIEWTIDEDARVTIASGEIYAPAGYFAADPQTEEHFSGAKSADEAIELFFEGGDPWREDIEAHHDLSEDEIQRRLSAIRETISAYRYDLTGEKIWD